MDTSRLDTAIQALTNLQPGRPALTPVGELALETLRFQREVLSGLDPDTPVPARQVVQGRLAAGNPALGFHDLHLDPVTYYETWNGGVDLFSRLGAITTAEADELYAEGESAERLLRLTEPWYEHGADESISVRSDLTPEMIGIAVRPWLVAAAERVEGLIDGAGWDAPRCPACGGDPDLGVLYGEGPRGLLCSRCDTLWTWTAEGCPGCEGPQGPPEYREGPTPGYLLLVCGGCDRALKTVDASRLPGVVPTAERVYAAELDHLAAELNLTT